MKAVWHFCSHMSWTSAMCTPHCSLLSTLLHFPFSPNTGLYFQDMYIWYCTYIFATIPSSISCLHISHMCMWAKSCSIYLPKFNELNKTSSYFYYLVLKSCIDNSSLVTYAITEAKCSIIISFFYLLKLELLYKQHIFSSPFISPLTIHECINI